MEERPDAVPSAEPSRREAIALAASLAAASLSRPLDASVTSTSPSTDDEPDAWPSDGAAIAITPAMIEAAERLAGIEFSAEERETISRTIGEQVSMFDARVKAGELPNDLAGPRLPGPSSRQGPYAPRTSSTSKASAPPGARPPSGTGSPRRPRR